MSCQNCNNPTPPTTITLPPGCSGCGSGCQDSICSNVVDSSCIVYTGPNLTCAGINTNLCLELALQKIDNKLCTVIGDYSGYNLSCLRSLYTINTAQQFAESISDYVCKLRADYNTFTTVTYPNDQANIQIQFGTILLPRITSCSYVNILNTDDLFTVLDKLQTASCNTHSSITAISGANWNQCLTVITPPTTLLDAFNVVLSYICQLNAGSGTVLPVFDNTGSCLPTPTNNDSLVVTINKIKTRLCQSPIFNAANLAASTCVQFSGSSTLENVIDAQNNQINLTAQQSVRAVNPSQFTLSQIDPTQPCLGMKLSLNSGVLDRFVALNSADLTPGTLFDKVAAGSNISLDFGVANAGKLTISSVGGITVDEKVKATATDPTAGFLNAKLIGGSDAGLTIAVGATAPQTQIQIQPTIDFDTLVGQILQTILDNETLRGVLCSIIASCPSPCTAPAGISVTYS